MFFHTFLLFFLCTLSRIENKRFGMKAWKILHVRQQSLRDGWRKTAIQQGCQSSQRRHKVLYRLNYIFILLTPATNIYWTTCANSVLKPEHESSICSLQPSCKVGAIIIPIFKIMKGSQREINELIQGHADKWVDFEPNLTPEAACLITTVFCLQRDQHHT